VGEAADGLELLKLLKTVSPHLIILDISMPNMRGIEAIHEIKATWPAIKIIILTMHSGKEYLHAALTAGAEGYLLKHDTETDLTVALETVLKGQPFISPMLHQHLTESLIGVMRGAPAAVSPDEPLTPRQRQVLKLLAEGQTNKEVAATLCISIKTVEHHRASIMQRLNLKNAVEMANYASARGYTSSNR
jgi:DNA-binding NarL/FixJ family response regulator